MVRKYLVDKKTSLMLFALVFVLYSIVYMTKNCFSAAMAAIVNAGIMTKSQTGLISAAFYLIYAPFQILGGFAADKYSPSKLITLGTFGACIANLFIYFFAQNYVAMIIIWSLNAVVQFGVWPSVFKIVSSELKPTHSPVAIFYIGLASITGLLLSYLFAIFISDWKNNFLMSSIALFIITALFCFSYNKIEKRMITENITPEPIEKAPVREKKKGEFLGLLIKSGVPFMLAVYTIHTMLNLGVKTVAPVMLMESYDNISPALANALNIILIVSGAMGIFVASIKAFRRISPPIIVFAFLILTVPLLFIVTMVGEVNVAFVVVSMAVTMLLLSSSSSYFSQISRTFAAYGYVGTMSGIFNCIASLGIVLSNFLFTTLSENYGWDFTTKFWFYLAIVATVLCLVANPIWKKFVKK